jgi:serine/threonine protein kinase
MSSHCGVDHAKRQNFLVDNTGHVKLTDFGLATGSLNPQRIDSMRHKVGCTYISTSVSANAQLDQVKDADLVLRSTLERRTMYRSMRIAEPRYVSRDRLFESSRNADELGRLCRWVTRLVS